MRQRDSGSSAASVSLTIGEQRQEQPIVYTSASGWSASEFPNEPATASEAAKSANAFGAAPSSELSNAGVWWINYSGDPTPPTYSAYEEAARAAPASVGVRASEASTNTSSKASGAGPPGADAVDQRGCENSGLAIEPGYMMPP